MNSMNDMKSILNEIEAFCRKQDLAETTFGKQAVNDGKFVARLRAGKSVTLRTLERVRAYMESQGGVPPAAKSDGRAPRAAAGRALPRAKGSDGKGKDGDSTAFRLQEN